MRFRLQSQPRPATATAPDPVRLPGQRRRRQELRTSARLTDRGCRLRSDRLKTSASVRNTAQDLKGGRGGADAQGRPGSGTQNRTAPARPRRLTTPGGSPPRRSPFLEADSAVSLQTERKIWRSRVSSPRLLSVWGLKAVRRVTRGRHVFTVMNSTPPPAPPTHTRGTRLTDCEGRFATDEHLE